MNAYDNTNNSAHRRWIPALAVTLVIGALTVGGGWFLMSSEPART